MADFPFILTILKYGNNVNLFYFLVVRCSVEIALKAWQMMLLTVIKNRDHCLQLIYATIISRILQKWTRNFLDFFYKNKCFPYF